MRVSISVSLQGVSSNPLPQEFYAQVRAAFEKETALNFFSLPDVKIQRLDHAIHAWGQWDMSFQAEGSCDEAQLLAAIHAVAAAPAPSPVTTEDAQWGIAAYVPAPPVISPLVSTKSDLLTTEDAAYVERLAASDGNSHDQAFYRRILATYAALAERTAENAYLRGLKDDAVTERDALRASLAAAQGDTEILEWVMAEGHGCAPRADGSWVAWDKRNPNEYRGDTFRAAIVTAIGATKRPSSSTE